MNDEQLQKSKTLDQGITYREWDRETQQVPFLNTLNELEEETLAEFTTIDYGENPPNRLAHHISIQPSEDGPNYEIDPQIYIQQKSGRLLFAGHQIEDSSNYRDGVNPSGIIAIPDKLRENEKWMSYLRSFQVIDALGSSTEKQTPQDLGELVDIWENTEIHESFVKAAVDWINQEYPNENSFFKFSPKDGFGEIFSGKLWASNGINDKLTDLFYSLLKTGEALVRYETDHTHLYALPKLVQHHEKQYSLAMQKTMVEGGSGIGSIQFGIIDHRFAKKS